MHHPPLAEHHDTFWREAAAGLEWETPFATVCDYARPPLARWFVGGRLNLCHNALDRHLPARAAQPALYYISTETGERRTLTFADLHREVNRMAGVLASLGVACGDRVIIYLPMMPEAVIAMLACVRLGAIHSVVFAGFAAHSLATRIDDAEPRLVITADASLRAGKLVRLKTLVDEALEAATFRDLRVLVVQRGLDVDMPWDEARDVDYTTAAVACGGVQIACVPVESSAPSYLLYTSGTTARPKGIQRDTGGYAVALSASMRRIYRCEPGETFFCAADIGWVLGHSYTLYGPLLHGMATVLYEGLPVSPDAGIWWRIAEETQATGMFCSPTALRVLKKHDPALIAAADLTKLRTLFVAGEPLDMATHEWIRGMLKHVDIIDNYWQTETGWPILAQTPGAGQKAGSPGCPVYGYDARVVDAATGEEVPRGEKGVLALGLPLPPGCMTTVWKNDSMFSRHYCGQFPGKELYSTFDYATQDADGFFFILGRTDDVINVCSHRLGTREIEEAVCAHGAVAECATVGAADETKGQVVKMFVVLKAPADFPCDETRATVRREIEETVVQRLGPIARPAFIGLVPMLPKTRSGKILRRAILAIIEGRETGDVSTLEDAMALQHIRDAHASPLS